MGSPSWLVIVGGITTRIMYFGVSGSHWTSKGLLAGRVDSTHWVTEEPLTLSEEACRYAPSASLTWRRASARVPLFTVSLHSMQLRGLRLRAYGEGI